MSKTPRKTEQRFAAKQLIASPTPHALRVSHSSARLRAQQRVESGLGVGTPPPCPIPCSLLYVRRRRMHLQVRAPRPRSRPPGCFHLSALCPPCLSVSVGLIIDCGHAGWGMAAHLRPSQEYAARARRRWVIKTWMGKVKLPAWPANANNT